jgi:hypothetical protein
MKDDWRPFPGGYGEFVEIWVVATFSFFAAAAIAGSKDEFVL